MRFRLGLNRGLHGDVGAALCALAGVVLQLGKLIVCDRRDHRRAARIKREIARYAASCRRVVLFSAHCTSAAPVPTTGKLRLSSRHAHFLDRACIC